MQCSVGVKFCTASSDDLSHCNGGHQMLHRQTVRCWVSAGPRAAALLNASVDQVSTGGRSTKSLHLSYQISHKHVWQPASMLAAHHLYLLQYDPQLGKLQINAMLS